MLRLQGTIGIEMSPDQFMEWMWQVWDVFGGPSIEARDRVMDRVLDPRHVEHVSDVRATDANITELLGEMEASDRAPRALHDVALDTFMSALASALGSSYS